MELHVITIYTTLHITLLSGDDFIDRKTAHVAQTRVNQFYFFFLPLSRRHLGSPHLPASFCIVLFASLHVHERETRPELAPHELKCLAVRTALSQKY